MPHNANARTTTAPVLIGDIGGTNTRFALVRADGGEPEILPAVATAGYPGIEEAIIELVHRGAGAKPRSAVLAVAAPIAGDRLQMTNGRWLIEPRRLIAELGFEEVMAVNDFEA